MKIQTFSPNASKQSDRLPTFELQGFPTQFKEDNKKAERAEMVVKQASRIVEELAEKHVAHVIEGGGLLIDPTMLKQY